MKQRSKNHSAPSPRPRPSAPSATLPPKTVPLSPARKRLFRLFAVVLVPCLLLGGLEGVLRLAGYGYSTSLFKPLRIGGHEYLVENDSFSYRFFPPELARTPGPIRMEPHKPAGTYRIFILGESAAMGDPEPAFGAARYLEVLLRERFPQQPFEIVNVAFTAINSHVILPIARECAAQDGDLWIIYMGNNEMVGPFGAATVFGPKAPPLGFVRFSLAVQKTRLGQMLANLGRRLRSKSSNPTAWAGMQMFLGNRVAPSSSAKEIVYRNFQRDLGDILRAGQARGAKILLNTVAVNLKDCPPFASLSDTNPPAGSRAGFEPAFALARNLESEGKFIEAAQAYAHAALLDPEFAELEFRWGNCLLRSGNAAAACEHFQRASDLDALPFRTDSRLNSIITQAARDHAGPNLVFLHAPRLLATNSPAGLLGQETFYEHVHFNFDGNYRLGRAWAEQVALLLPSELTRHAAAEWASQTVCERRLALTDWNRLIVVGDVERRMRQPPLSAQFNNASRLAALAAWTADLRKRMDPAGAAEARQIYREALERAPEDYCLHENFGTFLVANGDLPGATAQWQRVRELIPQDYLGNFRVGELLAQQNKPAEAQAALLEAARLRPAMSDPWAELGKLYAGQDKFDLALQHYDRALKLQPLDFQTWFNAGIALSKSNRRAEAIERYRQALRINPAYWQAHFELGGQLGLQGNLAEAKKELEEALRLEPDYAPAHLNLGVALMKEGRLDEATLQFQETIRLDPANKFASDYLAQLNAARAARR